MFTEATGGLFWGFGGCSGRELCVLSICGRPLQGRPHASVETRSQAVRRTAGAKRNSATIRQWIASIRPLASTRIFRVKKKWGNWGPAFFYGFAHFPLEASEFNGLRSCKIRFRGFRGQRENRSPVFPPFPVVSCPLFLNTTFKSGYKPETGGGARGERPPKA